MDISKGSIWYSKIASNTVSSISLSPEIPFVSKYCCHASLVGGFLLLLLLLAICIYGGFFNAGLGIITLSYLALAGYTNINTMNGLKLLISSVVSLIAIVLFIYDNVVVWYEGTIVMVGTLAGGYVAAHYSRRLPQKFIRQFIIIASTGITLYFFFDIHSPQI